MGSLTRPCSRTTSRRVRPKALFPALKALYSPAPTNASPPPHRAFRSAQHPRLHRDLSPVDASSTCYLSALRSLLLMVFPAQLAQTKFSTVSSSRKQLAPRAVRGSLRAAQPAVVEGHSAVCPVGSPHARSAGSSHVPSARQTEGGSASQHPDTACNWESLRDQRGASSRPSAGQRRCRATTRPGLGGPREDLRSQLCRGGWKWMRPVPIDRREGGPPRDQVGLLTPGHRGDS